ncbi:MAG: hypothetical protein GKS01_00495 [Alphaproteobacteria bacterium]|nr:hypothetical protein [Alphaproteobacteria bacterium]
MSDILNTTEFLILKSIQFQSGNAYGVSIRKELKEKVGRSFSYGTIYTTLRRLETKGYISTRKGEKSEVRGGRAKEFVRINGLGERVLTDTERMLNSFGTTVVKPQVAFFEFVKRLSFILQSPNASFNSRHFPVVLKN